MVPGSLSAGFDWPDADFALISRGRIAAGAVKKIKKNKNAKEISSLSELSQGDYVVHATHGIGVFEGIHKVEMNGIEKDYILIRYARNDSLYVPVTQLDMVSKYIGPREDSGIKLSRLGGADWQQKKQRVRAAVKDIAKELIELYAKRMQQEGHAFDPDGEWQQDFESRFEFEETEDQLRCVGEIKSDMERPVPMDRLLCGEGGFGDGGHAGRHSGAHHYSGLAALSDHLKTHGGLPGGCGASVPVQEPQAAGGNFKAPEARGGGHSCRHPQAGQ